MPTIVEMLESNARRFPDDVALIELRPSKNHRRSVSWREFNDNANRVANQLLKWGIKRDDKVIHWMRNSITWLETYFGIIKTSAWAVPLNYRFNAADFKYCADIAEAKAMFFEEEFAPIVAGVRPQLPTIRNYVYEGEKTPPSTLNYAQLLREGSASQPGIKLGPADECGLYFTSGTTGAPKPIVLTHGNMTFAAEEEQMHHHQTRQDNFIILPPLYHTGAKMHWYGSLITGSKGTILTEFSPKNVFEAVSNERGTIVWLLVPWVHDILVALDKGELKLADYNLSSWRVMHIGAQPVPPSLVKHWKQYFPHMQYDNNYGLSESTGPGPVHLGLENEFKEGAVGKVGERWQLRFVDAAGKDVKPGEVGELLIKGGGVMKEYYKNPELTARTIENGWMHTGDMARIDSEGYVFLVDRKKDVIIVGGENIYPIEVEDAIHKHPRVYDVAVIGMPDERLGEIVGAVIDPKPGEVLSEDEINVFLENVLPRYKRPRKIIFDKVPRNATGKIEKVKIREKYHLPAI